MIIFKVAAFLEIKSVLNANAFWQSYKMYSSRINNSNLGQKVCQVPK